MTPERPSPISPEAELSLVDVYHHVQDYSDSILNTDEYLQTLEEYDSEANPSVELYLLRGVQNSIFALRLLNILSDPQRKQLLHKEIDEEVIPDRWIIELAMQETIGDPRASLESETISPSEQGLALLSRVKEQDMNDILKKTQEGLDPKQESGFRLRAEIIGKGHDFIIDRCIEEIALQAQPQEDTTIFQS